MADYKNVKVAGWKLMPELMFGEDRRLQQLINEKLDEMQNGSPILSKKEQLLLRLKEIREQEATRIAIKMYQNGCGSEKMLLQRFAELDRENEQWVKACLFMGWILDMLYNPPEGRGHTHKMYTQMLSEQGHTEAEILSLLGVDIDSKEWQDVTVKIVETLKSKHTEPDFEWFKYDNCGKDETVWHAGDVTILGLIKK